MPSQYELACYVILVRVSHFNFASFIFQFSWNQIIRQYYNDGREAVRGILGNKTAIYIGDVFEPDKFNDGFWQDSPKYENTLLDSHFYHVFAEHPRSLSPRGHIAFGKIK